MRSLFPLCLAATAVFLTACHSNGGYFSSDPELAYGPGVVEFPEPERVYLPQYRRVAAASAIGVTAAAAQMARVSRPAAPQFVAAPPPSRPVAVSGPPPSWAPPPGAHFEMGLPPGMPQPGSHRVIVHDQAGPAPLPPPGVGSIGLHAGHNHPVGQVDIHGR